MAQIPPLAQFSTTPVFNTKAVARETGVPADTFRAWERRYGVPLPQRTPGGHRLYSERDIAIIRWLRDRTDEGVNISHAVMLLTNGADPPPASTLEEVRGLDRLTEDLLLALTSFDGQYAERVISEAFALYPFEDVLLRMVQPALIEVGERWHRGQINVATEHFASQFMRRKLSGLLNMFLSENHRGTIVVGCAPGELHDIGALLIAIFLVRRNWHVIYLGAQVPLADLLETVRALNPVLVSMSASTNESAIQIAEIARALHQAFPHVRMGFGGRIFNTHPELRSTVQGIFLGADARALVDLVETILARGATSASQQ